MLANIYLTSLRYRLGHALAAGEGWLLVPSCLEQNYELNHKQEGQERFVADSFPPYLWGSGRKECSTGIYDLRQLHGLCINSDTPYFAHIIVQPLISSC